LRAQTLADAGDNLRAQRNASVQALAAQVEKAILQTQVFRRRVLLFGDGERQGASFAENYKLLYVHFDFARGHSGVDCLDIACAHLALNL
jgi:hypothetical protein